MESKSISLVELLLIGTYLGSIIYLAGLFVFIVLVYKKCRKVSKKISLVKLILLCVTQLVLSIILSIFIWLKWIFSIDVLFGFVFIPSIISELIIISLFIVVCNKMIDNRWA